METDPLSVLEWRSEHEIDSIAKTVIKEGKGLSVWAFEGDLGAGKTTLIQAICSQLKVEDRISSPTFSLVNEYETLKGDSIYHFDFYRIEDYREALDIGIFEYLDSGNLCLIEWPQKIERLLPQKLMKLQIEAVEQDSRIMRIFKYE